MIDGQVGSPLAERRDTPWEDTRRPGTSRAWSLIVFAFAPPLVALADAAIVAGSFLGCYLARFSWQWVAPHRGLFGPLVPPPPLAPYVHASVLVAIAWIACLTLVGLYTPRREPSRFDDLVLLLGGSALGALLTLSLSFFYRSFSYSRLVFAAAFLVAFAGLAAFHLVLRTAQSQAMARGFGSRRTLVVGTNDLACQLAARLAARPRLGHIVVGAVSPEGEKPNPALPMSLLGDTTGLATLVALHDIDSVIVAWPAGTPRQILELVADLAACPHVAVRVAPSLSGLVTAPLLPAPLAGVPLLAIRDVPLRHWPHRLTKRAMDVLLAAGALLAAWPLLGAIGLAIRLRDGAPVVYAQERLGRDGRHFTIYKFRTMPTTAEADGPVWAGVGDERATPLGAWLRRFSLDELPQLWNVLKGDMSLVGPRPERAHFADRFAGAVPKYRDRHLVKSGLTGWAQVNGLRGDVSIEERTRYDIDYVENWSISLDLRIMVQTLATIFRSPS